MILELIKDLQQAGLETTAEELADILWLAIHVQEEVTVEPANTAVGATSIPTGQPATAVESTLREPEPASAPATKLIEPQASASRPGGELFLPDAAGDAEGTSAWGGEPFRAPAAASLPGKLALARALRPLKRRIDSRLRQELDIAETVRLSAESQTIMPVGRPTRIRWLDLILVVDEWSSMVIWQQTITELRHLLGQQGAFRNITTLGLATDPASATVQLHDGVGPGAQRHRARKAKELINPAGETLILVLSDCVSPAWHNGQVPALLKLWSGRVGKLALVQMLPERLWTRTALRGWLDAPLRARQAGLPNQKLEVTWPRRWRRQGKPPNVLKLPVITLEPESLQQWAQSVAGNGNLWVSGRVLLLEQDAGVPPQAPSPTNQRPAPKHQEPLERLEQFWSSASPTARKLAGYLAAAPLSLPTMWLVQQVMVKEARQVHLAEVFLSGLLRHLTAFDPDKDPAEFRYDFLNDEIRKRLLAAIDVTDRLDILNQVTSFIDRRTGQAMSFQAILTQPGSTDYVALSASSQPIAAVAAVVLESMGRTFAPVAAHFRKLEQGHLVAGYNNQAQPKPTANDGNAGDSTDWLHTSAPSIGEKGERPPQYYALLIGIDHYLEYRLPGGVYYPKLGGCVRDVNMVYQFLTERINIAPSNIIKLTASLGNTTPQEPEQRWPTYTNMVNAFAELTQRVGPGDAVYIHYAGHSGRATTIFPELQEQDFDEGLVPLDIGKPNSPDARYLRDVEIHELLKRLVDKGVQLSVIFDCGNDTPHRSSGGAVGRGISMVDQSPAPADSLVAPIRELTAHWQDDQITTHQRLPLESNWRFATKGYTFFIACRAHESAFEYPFNGRQINGALTYWLIDTWGKAGPDYTWKMVADRVTDIVNGRFIAQTPTILGESDAGVFGHERLSNYFVVAVLEFNQQRGLVRLAASDAHGLSPGTQFAVYPPGTTNFEQPEAALATLELTEVQDTQAWAKAVDGDIGGITGAQAVMLHSYQVRLQRDIRVAIEDLRLKAQVEAAISEQGRGFVVLAKENIDDYVVRVQEGDFVITDTTGVPIPNLRPALQVADHASIPQLVSRLVHLVKYQNVLMLDMPDPVMRTKLQVDLQEPTEIIRPGEQIAVKITNTQAPNAQDMNDPSRVLNVAVFVLSSDWSISQIYPENAAFEPVDPGKSIDLGFEAYLPDGETESRDVFKVFATRDATNFRWLELPTLAQSLLPRAATRSLITDPLEQQLASVTGEETTTRAVKLTKSSSPRQSWTTAKIELHVRAVEP